MADLLTWGALIAGAFLLVSRRSLISRSFDKIAGVGLIVVGLMSMGMLTGFSGVGQSSVSGEISDVTLADGNINGSTTTADYYYNDDDLVELWVTDAQLLDDGYIYTNVTIERASVKDAESFLMTCTSADFTKSGTVYNIVSKNTDSELEGYIDGAGTQRTTGWSKNIAFTEGDVDQKVEVSFKQDEAAEDVLSTKEKVSVECEVGGVPFTISVVAND